MPTPGQAIAAVATHNMPFGADQISLFEAADIAADSRNRAYKFMADDRGHLDGFPGPVVPVVDMDVRAANAGF